MNNSGRDGSVEQVILRIGQELFEAIRLKDLGSLRRMLADDFVHRTQDGTESGKEAFIKGVGTMPVEVTSIGGEHLRVNVYGDVAVMTGVQRAGWRQGEAAEGVSSVAFVDVFALRGGSWLLALAYGVELQS